MTKEAQYQYKCRHCGKVFTNIMSGEEIAPMFLINAIYKIKYGNQSNVPLMTVHDCQKYKKAGVADLIGFKIVNVK